MSKKEKCACGCGDDVEETCNCSKDCDCGENCTCDGENKCSEDCTCAQDKTPECDNNCKCEENKEYLKDLLRIQAEFDNYRKRMQTALFDARQDGFMDAIEQFIPAIDSFKMATEYIQDKNTLMGIKFIEKGILDTLSKMGVETIDATGMFNPELHQAIDTEVNTELNSGMIIKEVYKGFMYKGKVIRYSQVIVNK